MSFLEFLIHWAEIAGACLVVGGTIGGIVLSIRAWRKKHPAE